MPKMQISGTWYYRLCTGENVNQNFKSLHECVALDSHRCLKKIRGSPNYLINSIKITNLPLGIKEDQVLKILKYHTQRELEKFPHTVEGVRRVIFQTEKIHFLLLFWPMLNLR